MSKVQNRQPELQEVSALSMSRPQHTTEVMRRVATELGRLTDLIFAMELVLPSILESRTSRVETESLIAFQQLDRVAQTLTALSSFLTRLEPERPDDSLYMGSALTTVLLADLAERLGSPELLVGGSQQPDAWSSTDSRSGAIEIFQSEGP